MGASYAGLGAYGTGLDTVGAYGAGYYNPYQSKLGIGKSIPKVVEVL